MKFKIGFTAEKNNENPAPVAPITENIKTEAKKSVVRISFSARGGLTCSYYNDSFDLHPGDRVYVDGKLEGFIGRVVDVSYSFKIKLSDYKRVIGVVDTDIHGEFHFAGSHFVTFDSNALPFNKALSWFKAPEQEEEYVAGIDDKSFVLEDLNTMYISPETASRGEDYYFDNKVAYISLDGNHGYAIVKGSKTYEIEFQYENGTVSNLTCGCYCTDYCRHDFAAMLQLRETLKLIEKNYAEEYAASNYFAAVAKGDLFTFVIDGKEKGGFTF